MILLSGQAPEHKIKGGFCVFLSHIARVSDKIRKNAHSKRKEVLR